MHRAQIIPLLPFFLVISITTFFVGASTTVFMGLATMAYLSMVTGYWFRTKKYYHVPLMLFAILVDISLVLILEAKRNAINTAVSFSLSPLQQMHILMSSIATILYFPTLAMGYKLVKTQGVPPRNLITWHKRIAKSAFFFRTLGFILMFSLISHVKK